jgi:uncharacterized coiled-coil protein SlyX
MSNLRPESRIKSLEQRATDIEAGIIELSSDQAEELKAIRLEIKQLDEGMMSSFKELGGYFELTEKAMATKDDLKTLATKQDISTLETRLSKIEDTQEQILKLLQHKPSE